MKDIKFIKILTSKYEFNDPNEKLYWKDLIKALEKNAAKKTRKTYTNTLNLSQSLPKSLYNRVSKIVKLNHFDEDTFEEKEIINLNEILDDHQENNTKELTKEKFNESTVDFILDEEREYLKIDLKIDPEPKPRKDVIEYDNWLSNYMHKNPKDRIKWNSKLYQFEKKLLQKPLFEQADFLIDLAADDFNNWINLLSSDSSTEITKELIKGLFPIGLEGDASKALYVENKQIKAIPNEVAHSWNLPELALESNIIRLTKQDNKDNEKQQKYIAFGKAIPMEFRHPKPGTLTKSVSLNFPEDLKTKEALFRGIIHLRSTKAIVQHFLDNPQLKRPKYLTEKGLFARSEKEDLTKHVPLYEYFSKK